MPTWYALGMQDLIVKARHDLLSTAPHALCVQETPAFAPQAC